MKAVWKRVHFYKIDLVLSYNTIPMPRERDCKIVKIIILHEKSVEIQLSLNQVRMKLQAMFLSCITTFGGNQISEEHLYHKKKTTRRLPTNFQSKRRLLQIGLDGEIFGIRYIRPTYSYRYHSENGSFHPINYGSGYLIQKEISYIAKQ